MSSKVLESVSIVTLVSLLLRWGVSLYPYSGAGKPPMFGDYEAQRHWQEITINLPVQEWYRNSSSNDLLYWGLDYPPLTAYHSYVNGLVAGKLNDEYVALDHSRGFESSEHKLFMRYTVFVADILVFIPAAFYLMAVSKSVFKPSSKTDSKLNFLALLTYPGIILIDYGHFQYNNLSIGLMMAAVAAVVDNFDCLGSVLFSLALNYKQMELYHALPFFFFLLGKTLKEETFQRRTIKLFTLAGSVVLTFIVVWAPYLQNYDSFIQVMKRVFPINRGLFEDKVANVWCSLSIFVKLKDILDNFTMALICLVSTGITSLPSCINLLLNSSSEHFKYCLVNVSFVFFLLSYHVHEKSILLVTVPACMLFSNEPLLVTWLLAIAQLSMLPLLVKDGLLIPSIVLTVLSVLVYMYASSVQQQQRGRQDTLNNCISASTQQLVICCSALMSAVLALCLLLLSPPARYPDLFPVLISIFCCAHFVLFAVHFHYKQFTLPDRPRSYRVTRGNKRK
uniref:Alpha-1,3-glucosyltransferase n=1 Tax=Hirondellea gigas TaxID=1518452 RepID=A0A2P2I4J2_9CRUS